jgi:hypothetical protein
VVTNLVKQQFGNQPKRKINIRGKWKIENKRVFFFFFGGGGGGVGGDKVDDYLGEGGNYVLRLIFVKTNFGLFFK